MFPAGSTASRLRGKGRRSPLIFGSHQRLDWGPVEGLRVGRFSFGVNTTFVVYRIGSTLIDAGPPNQARRVLAFARERRLDYLLLTHHHEDHSGNAAPLQKLWPEAAVLAPAASLPLLEGGFPIHFYRRQVWGVPQRLRAQPLPEQLDDLSGNRWQVIPTPGHADDMVAFFEPERGWLFAADLYVATRVRYARPEDRLHLEIESLRKTSQLDFETLFCSHRGPIARGPEALKNKLDYLLSLRQEVCELHQRGWSRKRILRQTLGREDHVSWLSGFHFCKSNLVEACLRSQGR